MGSYSVGKDAVVSWIRERFNTSSTILDVGACDGKWRRLLPDYVNMDAVEIFEPNFERIKPMYRYAFHKDIAEMEYDWYDLIIFGDVIEHMDVPKAQKVLEYAKPRCRDMVVAVPFLYIQDEIYGNPWERHIQEELTPELFDERYEGFEVLLDTAYRYCYYHKRG